MAQVSCTLAVRLTPRSRRNRVLGRERDAAGHLVVRAAVAAAPVDGAANLAAAALIAEALDLPKSAVSLVAGASAKMKRFRVEIAPERLAHWLDGLEELG